MRPRPLSILLLLALSSFAFAQLTGLNSGGSGISGSIPSAFSCFTSLSGALPAIMVLMVGGGMVLKKKNEGGGMMSALGPIMGLMILIQAAMNGALCKGNAVMFIAVFSILETIMASDTGSKNPMMGILNMILILPIFQYILSSPSLMNNPTSLMGVLIIPLLLSGAMDAGSGSISFSGFTRGVWNGLKGGAKILKGPEGERTEDEIKKEMDSKLTEIEEYIIKLRKQADTHIKQLHKEAKKAARQESRAMGYKKRDKYSKIEERLEKDENELTLLSNDISKDIQAIGDTTQRINNFEKTLRTELKKTFDMVIPFIREHSTDDAEKITKQGAVGSYELRDDMQNAVKIRNSLQGSVNIILNGMASFAKLSVLMETVEKILGVADKDLGDTSKTERKKESNKKKKWKEQASELEKDQNAI